MEKSKVLIPQLKPKKVIASVETNSCCCGTSSDSQKENCVFCGKPLIYFPEEKLLECRICHRIKPANAACEDGHFVCDECHSGCEAVVLTYLRKSNEKDPIALLHQIFKLEDVHLHGPEHHSIVPCVLITAFHNCGGQLDFDSCLLEAWKRGKKISGGACGFLGVCGAAAGAGIFASIVSGATPLTGKQWAIPQRLTAACLEAMAEVGGPRCCKRTSRIAVECAVEFSQREFGVSMPVSRPDCTYWSRNNECIRQRCPFFPKKRLIVKKGERT